MRGFIKFCGGIFVLAGLAGVCLTIAVEYNYVRNLYDGTTPATLSLVLTLAGGVFGSAAVTMIGGVAYMLCRIDERIERAMQIRKQGTKDAAVALEM